ncbi:MAG: aldehyde ferredoxin oxidoreductase C-terminal domain-containing protein, partial [Eubacteriales bacterium]|nr:aldehyde ferredoxin oxidoreductase C-terminal domain-containing protein [Eubacteriales bacterium]
GAPVSYMSRVCVNAKSPLTNCIADSQAGGWFGPELKFAGFDGIVIKGKADTPVYISINSGKVEIKDAKHIWGKDTGEADDIIKSEIGSKNARIMSIGKAGENLVKYACIINERRHANGRNGLGAVMGAKNLKAIAAKGDRNSIKYFDKETLGIMAREDVETIKTDPLAKGLTELGTNDGYVFQNEFGGLPTRNFNTGSFDKYLDLAPEELHKIYHKNETCYACAQRCKITLRHEDPEGKMSVDPSYGGPEYETTSSIGSYVCNSDKIVLAKAHELCNRYGIDTISMGATIAFAMECYENGIIDERIDGQEIKFGNSDIIIPLIEMTSNREGIGNMMAEGSKIWAEALGDKAKAFSIEVKGNALPAHMPRQKNSMALIYAVNPFGADHCSTLTDFEYCEDVPEEERGFMRMLDLNFFGSFYGITKHKTKMVLYTQMYHGFIDSIGICIFSVFLTDPDRISRYIKAITGWDTSLFEFMKIGERKVNMMKYFNWKHGIRTDDDSLPKRMFEAIPDGYTKDQKINKEEFESAIKDYYDMAGWDIVESKPLPGKLKELDLEWLL